MVDQIGVDGVLEVPAAKVREEDVDGFLGTVVFGVAADCGRTAATGVCRDCVVDGFDDVWMTEELVCFDFFHGTLDGLLAKWTCSGRSAQLQYPSHHRL